MTTTTAKKQRAVLVLSTFALVVAGALGGCAKHDAPGVATAKPNAKSSSSTNGNNAAAGGVAAFGKCMRDAGFSWWPDPDGSGRINASPPAGVVVDEQKLSKAQQTCSAKYMNRDQAPAMSAEEIAQIKKHSKCMRDNGLPNYPDPDGNGNVDLGKAKIEDNTPEWAKATAACKQYELQPKDRGNS
jgi:hypothetical protein